MPRDQQRSIAMPGNNRPSSLSRDHRFSQRLLSSTLGDHSSDQAQASSNGLSGQSLSRAHTFNGTGSSPSEVARGRSLVRRHSISAGSQGSSNHNPLWTARSLKHQDWKLGSGFRSMSPAAVDKESRYGLISFDVLQDPQDPQAPSRQQTHVPNHYERKRAVSFDSASSYGFSSTSPSKVEWRTANKEPFVPAVNPVPRGMMHKARNDRSMSPGAVSNASRELSDLSLGTSLPTSTDPIPIPPVKQSLTFDCFQDVTMKLIDQEDVMVHVLEVDSARSRSRSPSPPSDTEMTCDDAGVPPRMRRKLSIAAMIKNSKEKGAYSATRNILRKDPPSIVQTETEASSSDTGDFAQTVPEDVDPMQVDPTDTYRLRVEIPKSPRQWFSGDYIPSMLGPNRAFFRYQSPWLELTGTVKRNRSSYDRPHPQYPVLRRCSPACDHPKHDCHRRPMRTRVVWREWAWDIQDVVDTMSAVCDSKCSAEELQQSDSDRSSYYNRLLQNDDFRFIFLKYDKEVPTGRIPRIFFDL